MSSLPFNDESFFNTHDVIDISAGSELSLELELDGDGDGDVPPSLKDTLLLHMLPRRQSPHAAAVHDTVRALADAWGVRSFDHFRRLGVSFSAAVYPGASPQGLAAACAHLSLWILLDDLCFDRADLDPRRHGVPAAVRRGSPAVAPFLTHLCDLFRCSPDSSDSSFDAAANDTDDAAPAAVASRQLGLTMRLLAGDDWVAAFADAVEGYVAANLELAHARTQQRSSGLLASLEQDLDAYTRLRVHTSGCTFAASLVELTTGAVLPPAVRAHPAVQELTRAAALATCFANDIFSYHNETAVEPGADADDSGDFRPLNVIQLFMDTHGLRFPQAARRAVHLVNSYVAAFLATEARLPHLYGIDLLEHGAVLLRYVHGLKEYMSGWFHWHYNNNRYRSPGQPFPELRSVTGSSTSTPPRRHDRN